MNVSQIFDKNTANIILQLIKKLESARYIKRNILPVGRGIDGSSCNYNFCGEMSMPKDLRKYLREIAPTYKDALLGEVAINKYDVGDFIGKHKDRDLYRYNLTIALQELGDGLYVDDYESFIEDIAGQGVLFEGVGPAHSVPKVKYERYCLIYLYE